jgi:sigma-54 dependent transcriptional regulator, flagellar regulatory protein
VHFARRTLAALAIYPWTGNVRELGNLIERLSITAGGRIVQIEDLPPKYRPAEGWVWEEQQPVIADDESVLGEEETLDLLESGASDAAVAIPPQAAVSDSLTALPEGGIDLRAHLLAIERALVQQALDRANGTVAHAARLLNLRRTTLVEKLRKLGIEAATEV